MWSIFCKIIGTALLLLGAHGLYVYANPFFSGADAGKLFTEFDLNVAEISRVIRWMTISATQSWIVPGALIVIGYLLFKVRGKENARY